DSNPSHRYSPEDNAPSVATGSVQSAASDHETGHMPVGILQGRPRHPPLRFGRLVSVPEGRLAQRSEGGRHGMVEPYVRRDHDAQPPASDPVAHLWIHPPRNVLIETTHSPEQRPPHRTAGCGDHVAVSHN